MPTDEQTITNLEGDVNTLAQTIYSNSLNLSETIAAHNESFEEIETMRAEKLSIVLNDRFEINHKLKYTNEDQRKIAVQELLDADTEYQAMKNAAITLTATKAEQLATLEKNRNFHKSKLLVLQYYATLP